MRFISFWKMQTLKLSKTERVFFRDAIIKLQTWEVVKKEYADLELIKKILEAGMDINTVDRPDQETNTQVNNPQNKERVAYFEKTL